MVVVDGNDLAIGAHNRPDIANIATTAVVSERERIAPGLALVGAESGVDAEGLSSPAVDQAEPAVGKTAQARRVALTGVGLWGG